MNAFELFRHDKAEPISSEVWACGKCGQLFGKKYFSDRMQEAAEQCCKPKLCLDCGVELPKGSAMTVCGVHWADRNHAREMAKLEKAEKLDAFEGMVCWGDTFYPDLEAFIDDWDPANELPEYVWACKPRYLPRFDVDEHLLQPALENIGPDSDDDDLPTFEGMTALKEAFNVFNEANKDTVVCWEVDEKRAVRVKAEEASAV